ncbi:MAG TPA: DUF3857 domain-containing transglutaminase family protein [Gemmatimonadaceae bacterium]
MRRHLVSAALLPLLASPLLAQAPRITPAGDPSVRDDSIYALALKQGEHSDEPYVFLLDDGVVRLEADGRATRTYRQVIQLLTPEAAERWGEHTFGYSPGREKLTVNWVKVLDRNGKVISAKPTHEQESAAPVALEAPVYSDQRIRRVTLGGVAPGTIVDYSFTVETVSPLIPNDFFDSWSVITGVFTRRSRLVLDVPASLSPKIVEHHIPFARKESVSHGRHVYVWAAQDIPKPEVEPLAPDTVYGEDLTVTAPIGWGDVARWYASLSRDRYTITPEIAARIAEVVRNATTLDDSVRAVHRWVAQDFRYVSLSLGIAGYQPHPPAEVFRNKYGDCKDKATLFIAALAHLGVKAYPVLLASGGGVDRSTPTAHAFDHMIAAVERPAGGYTFVDLTADLTPYGSIPPAEQGEFGLVVHPDGRGEEVTFPTDSASANRAAVRIVGTLDTAGVFNGRWTRTASGTQQYSLRGSMSSSTKLDSTERARATLAIANAIIEGASGDSLQLFDGRDLRAEPRISVLVKNGHAVTSAGDTRIFTLPIRDFAAPNVVSSLQARGPRTKPIDFEKVWGLHEDVEELRVTLPPGWTARLPRNVRAVGEFGAYTAEYAQDGRELRVTRTLRGTKGVAPASDMPALIDWLKALSADDVKYIVLQPGS